jgi:hypothetical protein
MPSRILEMNDRPVLSIGITTITTPRTDSEETTAASGLKGSADLT